MADIVRPRRSALYLPGNNPRVLEKGTTLAADAVIFDLEDAVGPDEKQASRERVCAAVDSGRYQPREQVIRINGLGTQWHDDDLSAVARSQADGVLVPKVESAEQVHHLVSALDAAGARPALTLWVMIETPAAFLRVHTIAEASDQLQVLIIGTNDLVNDLHGLHRPGRAPIMTALQLAVLGARAAGKAILDGVFNAIRDEAGFTAEVRQGRDMGFDGKTVIHPSQIAPANDIYGPSADEVTCAQAIITAYEQAQAAGDSVIVVDGQMIESLHVRDAHRIMAFGEHIRRLEAARS